MPQDVPERWQSLKFFLCLLYFDLSEVNVNFVTFHEPNCNSSAIFIFVVTRLFSLIMLCRIPLNTNSQFFFLLQTLCYLGNERYLIVKSNVGAIGTLNRRLFFSLKITSLIQTKMTLKCQDKNMKFFLYFVLRHNRSAARIWKRLGSKPEKGAQFNNILFLLLLLYI